MVMASLPPALHERVVCSVEAAIKYDVPANIVLAVAELENGKPGLYRTNDNGTQDIGTMQFNTSYLHDLSVYGITAQDVAAAGCYPYELATWRLRQHILHDKGDLWTKAADYHSYTPEVNAAYRARLIPAARRWAGWLMERYNTRVASNK